MTNEEKAMEIAIKICGEPSPDDITGEYPCAEDAALEMAEWKDEPKEIQNVIQPNFKSDNDWNQVRIQAAIAAMQGILTNDLVTKYTDGYATRKIYMSEGLAASKAIAYADALVEELKKEK